MDCPKCRAHNPDDAPYCTFCYENFKPKPAARGRPRRDLLVCPDVATLLEGVYLVGPLVAALDGFYFFLRGCRPAGEDTRAEMVTDQLGLAGLAATALFIDRFQEWDLDGAPGSWPAQVSYGETRSVIGDFGGAFDEAPAIPSCRKYFHVARGEIRSLRFDFSGALAVRTAQRDLSIQGIPSWDQAAAFFKLKGYPLSA